MNTASPPKPPPMYIPHVSDIQKMTNSILSVIDSNDFNYKALKNNEIRVAMKTIEWFRKILKYLETKTINFHTFQIKEERAYRIVVKGLHYTTPVEDIKAEFIQRGHQVRYIANAKSRATKQPLSMFFIDLDPSPNNKDVFNIRDIGNALVTIEAPKHVDDLVQCYRCQEFGHTKSYCKKPFRCVKCGLSHPTAECSKERNVPPQCVHCLQNHTANYKGCKVYQDLIYRKYNGSKEIMLKL